MYLVRVGGGGLLSIIELWGTRIYMENVERVFRSGPDSIYMYIAYTNTIYHT